MSNSNQLEQTWRWYGPNDTVSLADARQAGVQGIVTALHHVPLGEIWSEDEIDKRHREVLKSGLHWSVIESLPIHEDIKTRSGQFTKYIENYKVSLRNIGQTGIRTLCYNVMPVVDWTRTQLDRPFEDGSTCLGYDHVEFAVFDLFILKRPGAEANYGESILQKAEEKFKQASPNELTQLEHNVVAGLPGADQQVGLGAIKKAVAPYAELTREDYRQNIQYFLQEVIPVASENGISMAVHPDDPPFDIMGTPRIVSSMEDVNLFLKLEDNPANGLTLCTGSFGARSDNDIVKMIAEHGQRIHFVHLRNVKRYDHQSFYEDNHLDGDTDMYKVMKELIKLTESRKSNIPLPFRPDHGHRMLDDLNKESNPGYSVVGRLRGLAELRGLEIGIRKSLN